VWLIKTFSSSKVKEEDRHVWIWDCATCTYSQSNDKTKTKNYWILMHCRPWLSYFDLKDPTISFKSISQLFTECYSKQQNSILKQYCSMILLKILSKIKKWLTLRPPSTTIVAFANSTDPDQTAPEGAVWSGSILFDIQFLYDQNVHYLPFSL